MGCLFSKKSLSTSAASDRVTTSTRVHHLSNSNSNGIVRVPKIGLQNGRTPDASYNESNEENSHQLRMIPPPPAPPPSPPLPIKSPHPEPTGPPTPEDERPILHVQYAEDLEPVSPILSEMMTSDIADRNSRSKLSVSNVTLKPNINGIRGAPMPLQDLSIEELDPEMDEFNRYRGKRFSFREGESLNPSTTDILLPRRKETSTHEKGLLPNADKDGLKIHKPQSDISKHKRIDTPSPNITTAKKTNQKDVNIPLKVEEISDDVTTDSKDNFLSKRSEIDKINMTKLNVASEREENIVTFDMSKDERYVESTSKDVDDLSLKPDHSKSRPGTLTDIHVQTSQELKANSQSIPIPQTMYETDLQKSRMSRKRKLKRNRKADYTPRGTFNEKENEGFVGGTLKTLKGRPGSETSTWTLNSKGSLGSIDTLHSFDMEADIKPDRYSYISSGTTPVSFKNFYADENTEIIDLEDNGDLNNDSWLTDDPVESKHGEPFDMWYGMKPYEVVQSRGRKDAGIVKSFGSGPSSSEISTKQKLMYSRFARRPQSESMLKKARKPPLPPGSELRMRPASDTVKRSHAVSTYFTTDLDIH